MLNIKRVVWTALTAATLVGFISLAAGKSVSADVQGEWRGEYYNNMTLSGLPAMIRVDRAIDFNWGVGSPEPGVVGVPRDHRRTGGRRAAGGLAER